MTCQSLEMGIPFDGEKCKRKNEVWPPIILFYVVLWIISFPGLNIMSFEIYLIALITFGIRGPNHYFRCIGLVKED